ncbi:MAG: hypothetical protein KBT36_06135, partial [Kurthia sp.]|nr:hypothetical protein [Candidatus Kurthia equi]
PVVGEKGALTSSLLSENWSSVVNTILDEKIELTVEALDLEEDSITFIYILTKNKNENNKVTNKIRVDVLTSAENEARVAKFYAAVQNKSAINDDYYTFTGVDVDEDKITILNDKVNDKIKANSEVNPNNTTLTFAELVKIIQAVNESNESNEKTPDETVE